MKNKELFSLIGKNKNAALAILLFDALFVVTLLALAKIFELLIPDAVTIETIISPSFMIFTITLSLIYIFLAILTYSFFKFLVLSKIASMKKKASLDFSRLPKFYLSNISLFSLFAVFYLIASYFASTFGSYVGMFVGAFMVVFSYPLLNVRHSLFIKSKKYTFAEFFDELSASRRYSSMLLADALVVAVYAAIVFVVGSILSYLVTSYKISAYANDPYAVFFAALTYIALYALLFVNRMHFYMNAGEKK